ncbi:hypothetical protein [Pedobacter frigoris]|uniref:hypothetical protein n=1 Tax=Pedobacter frigoris TaxID=2571272 RepID=UPI0029318A2D|nr:hypothetical protein [Pedobacter frigoris]
MEIATYVIYELLIRLQELNPGVGEYVFSKRNDSGVLLRTSTGSIDISEELLNKQFHHPSSIDQDDISTLLKNFKFTL